MIKAEELRQGNLIYTLPNNADIVVVNGTFKDSVFIRDYDQPTTAEMFNPIPLSTAILEKCPDAKAMDGINWHVRLGATYLILRHYATKWYCELPDGFYIGEITSLHRLQNIVHSLSGTELTITL